MKQPKELGEQHHGTVVLQEPTQERSTQQKSHGEVSTHPSATLKEHFSHPILAPISDTDLFLRAPAPCRNMLFLQGRRNSSIYAAQGILGAIKEGD